MIQVKFWGVRGSIASAGAHTAQVGGNTSCVEVRLGQLDAPDTLVILDAGTGLRALGDRLQRGGGPVHAHLLLSHFHWDHIQGFPFFGPAFDPQNQIDVYGPERCAQSIPPQKGSRGSIRAAFEAQMSAPHFPVGLDVMRARLSFRGVAAGAELAVGPGRVRAGSARHPNGCLAYRIEHAGRSVVYATDTEHDAHTGQIDPALRELAAGADLLIYDAQYTTDEYHGRAGGMPRIGWGHSTAEEGARLAEASGVGQLVLFHHDPSHDDWAVARIEAEARTRFPRTVAAREGLALELPAAPPATRDAAA
jgi:phosphoribosyl 1,2-cyclic phosphodiesterase